MKNDLQEAIQLAAEEYDQAVTAEIKATEKREVAWMRLSKLRRQEKDLRLAVKKRPADR